MTKEKNKKEHLKEIKGYKNILVLTFLLLGSQIGAGYASGREIIGFFGDYSWFNIVLIGILFLGYALLLNAYGRVGKQLNAENVTDVTKAVFGKFSFLADGFLLMSLFACLSATIAGVDSVAEMTFTSYSFPWLSILICVIVISIVSGGLKSVLKASSFIVPTLITTMFVTLVYFLFFGSHGQVDVASPTVTTMGLGVVSAFLYIGSNLTSSGTLLTQLGSKFDNKNIRWSTFLFALLFSMGAGLILSSLYLSSNAIFSADMPLAELALSINGSLGILFSVVLFMEIAMSITAVSFSLTLWAKKYFKSRFVAVSSIIIIGYIISRLGFGIIIDYIYPIEGLGGVIAGIGVYIYYRKHNKKEIK